MLARLEGVADVAVVGVPDERLGEVGKAFVVRAEGAPSPRTTWSPIAKERAGQLQGAAPGRLHRQPAPQPLRQGAQDRAAGSAVMDPDPVRDRARLPGRGAGVAGGQRAGRAVAVDGHPGGVGAPPGVGAAARRRALVGGVVAEGVRRPRGVAGRVGDLRGGVLPRRRARPGLPERHLPARPDPLRPRHQGAAGPVPPHHGHRGADLGAVLVRARGRLRPRLAALDRAPRRRARRLGAQRPEDLVVAGDVRALGVRAVPLRPRGRAAPRPDLLPLPAGRRRGHGPAHRPAGRRGGLRGGLLRGRLRAGLRRARRARRRLAGGDEHGRQRARAVAPLPRPVLRRRGPAGRALPLTRPTRTRRTASSTPGSRRRPTGSTRGAR